MNRSIITTSLLLASVAFPRGAKAAPNADSPAPIVEDRARPDANADHSKPLTTPVHRPFGMSTDFGVPDGAAVGLAVRPRFDWLRIGAAVTYNGMGPGVRAGVTLDPIAFPIAPTLTVEGGHSWRGTIPGIKDSPSVGYNYANFDLGLEVGNRETFRFFLRGGVSWIDMSAAIVSGASGGIGNPSYSGWLVPSGKLGFSTYF